MSVMSGTHPWVVRMSLLLGLIKGIITIDGVLWRHQMAPIPALPRAPQSYVHHCSQSRKKTNGQAQFQ